MSTSRAVSAVAAVMFVMAACNAGPLTSEAASDSSLGPDAMRGIAAQLAVDADAFVPTEDGVVVARHVAGVTEVDLIRAAGGQPTITAIARIKEAFLPDSAFSSTNAVDCADHSLTRSQYLFGASSSTDRTLRLEGLRGVGGKVSASAWVFALDAGQNLDRPFQIFGTMPLPVGAGEAFKPTTPCTAP